MGDRSLYIARSLGFLAARLIYGLLGCAVGLLSGFLIYRFVGDLNNAHLVFLIPTIVVGLISAILGDRFLGQWIWSHQDATKDSYEGRGGL